MNSKYLIAGLIFIASVIIAVVLVYPKYQDFKASEQLVADKQSELDAESVLINEINRVQSKYKKAEDDLSNVSSLLPTFNQKSFADLFIEMENITSESGVLINSISFDGGPAKSDGKYKIINTKLTVSSSYEAFKKFASVVEKNQHLMDITTISITPGLSDNPEAKSGGTTAEDVVSNRTKEQSYIFMLAINTYYQY